MVRRAFLALMAGALVPASLRTNAQSAARVFRIGWLLRDPIVDSADMIEPINNALRALGYHEGRNAVFLTRSAAGDSKRLDAVARELVALGCDVILAPGLQEIRAAMKASARIPIVMVGAPDPVANKLVESLARPGGNVTGASNIFYEALVEKALQVLRDAVPKARHIAIIMETRFDNRAAVALIDKAAARLRMTTMSVSVAARADLGNAFKSIDAQRPSAAIIVDGEFTGAFLEDLARHLTAAKLPSISLDPDFAPAGGLLSYGPTQAELVEIVSTYVDRILKGTKPAELPVAQPSKFSLVINIQTAKSMGLTIPQTVLAGADKLIE